MTAETLIGQTVADRYKVLSDVGSGGFGMVYLAKHVGLNNPVALKVLHAHLIANAENVERFRREAEATSRLRHSAIAGVFDFGVLPDGRPYMVMEYLSGNALGNILDSQGKLPPERAVPLFVECCDALRYAHRKGLLHRDIKPDNIFIVQDMDGVEHVKLLDFGLAKMIFSDEKDRLTTLTESGTALGTPWYMSPEQCQALPVDARSDIYSLAYSLYETLAGKRAFPGTTHYEAMHAHLTQKPPALNPAGQEPVIPAELEAAIMRALAKSPNDRHSTADEFRQALIKSMPDIVFHATSSGDSPERAVATANNPQPAAKAVEKDKSSRGVKVERSQSIAMYVAAVAIVLLIAVSGAFAMWWQASQRLNQQAKAPVAPAPITSNDEAKTAPAVTVAAPSSSREPSYVYRPAPIVQPAAPQTKMEAPINNVQNISSGPVNSQPVDATARRLDANELKLQQAQAELSRLQEQLNTRQEPPAQKETVWPESSLSKSTHYLPTDDHTTYSYASGTTNSSAPATSSPPAGWAPMPYGGQPLPGNPPPGAPGHIPPPGFPPAPPVPGSSADQR